MEPSTIETIKLNSKWHPLFNSPDRYYVLTGGRGSGKSFAISYFALALISTESNHRVAVYRVTMTSAAVSIMQDMKDMVKMFPNKDELEVKQNQITNTRTGSYIFFKGAKASDLTHTAALKGLSNCTTFILDEGEELTRQQDWDKINDTFRLKHPQVRMIISLNPATKEHWIYNHFFTNNGWSEGQNGSHNNVTYIHTSYLDNLDNLGEDKILEWERAKEDRPDYYNHVILGGWRDRAEGVILTRWEKGEYPKRWELPNIPVQGFDFGFDHPSALVETCIDDLNKKIYVKLLYYKSHATEDDWLSAIKRNNPNNYVVVCDSAAPQHIKGMKLKGRGLKLASADKGPDSVLRGLDILNSYTLIIDPGSVELIRELNNYTWKTDTTGNTVEKPNKHMDDAIDAMRYAVFYQKQQRHTRVTNSRKPYY